MHDSRCEADWNDGLCACKERSEPLPPFDRPEPTTIGQRISRLLALHR